MSENPGTRELCNCRGCSQSGEGHVRGGSRSHFQFPAEGRCCVEHSTGVTGDMTNGMILTDTVQEYDVS